jgi:penicillin-binding protein 1A
VFANGGNAAPPYGITQIANSAGEIVYEHSRDDRAPERVLPEQTVAQMNGMLVQVPEWGTGRAAKLDGIPTAGKTGTTSSFRDGWFVGFTGNFVGAVWFGNDNYEATDDLTGGTLPAQTWNQVMTAAHQGAAIRPIPYVDRPEYEALVAAPAIAAAAPGTNAPQPAMVLPAGVQRQLEELGRLFAAPAAAAP